ncbi:MAG: diacylglycerol/polyprenol kinase family protein [Candidatus Obscuribacterales bacterium]
MTGAFTAMSLVMAALVSVIHFLSGLRKDDGSNSESIRKTLHIFMGTLTLSFPWLFQAPWPVVALSIFASLFICLVKVSNMKAWAPVVCARGRSSIGEICFPLSVGLVFLLAGGDRSLYMIPVAILTFADAGSALIGMRFGRRRFHTADGIKTTEGSLAFALIAFVATTMILSLTTGPLPAAQCLALAGIVALIAMLFEAISWKGLDNLLVPLGSYLALKTHMSLAAGDLGMRMLILVSLAAAIIFARRKTTLNGSAIAGVALFCYFAWILGGPLWALSPVLLYGGYRVLLPARYRDLRSSHSIYAVISVASAGIVWLLFSSRSQDFIFPYTLTFACHAAIIAIAHMRFSGIDRPHVHAIVLATMKAWCLLCLPFLLLYKDTKMIMLVLFLAPIAIGAPAFLFYLVNTRHRAPATRSTRWIKQALFAAMASVLGFLAIL